MIMKLMFHWKTKMMILIPQWILYVVKTKIKYKLQKMMSKTILILITKSL